MAHGISLKMREIRKTAMIGGLRPLKWGTKDEARDGDSYRHARRAAWRARLKAAKKQIRAARQKRAAADAS